MDKEYYIVFGSAFWILGLLVLIFGLLASDILWQYIVVVATSLGGIGLGTYFTYISHYLGESGYRRFKKMWLARVKEGSHNYRKQLEENHSIHFERLQKEMRLHQK